MGLLDYEADIIIMSKADSNRNRNKTSTSDLIADSFKSHKHKSNLVKYLYFAIPRKLENPYLIYKKMQEYILSKLMVM